MSERDQWESILNALSDPYRRHLLVALLQHNPQDDDLDPMDIVADTGEDEKHLQIQMVHTHLPKLEDLGFIAWDSEENRINRGPRWDDIKPVLSLIEDHRDELPRGWL